MSSAITSSGSAKPETWAAAPFFVIGYVRSGTTLLRRMLDSHPDLFVPGELDEFQRIPSMLRRGLRDETALDAFIAALPIFYKEVMYDPDRFRALATQRLPLSTADVIRLLKSTFRDAVETPHARWGHKEPHEWPFLYKLRDWYPDAQFIHILRSPQDVAGSVKQYRDIGLHSVKTTPVISAWHWRVSVRSVREQGRTLGEARYHFLRYEDLVADPERTLRSICGFLGVSEAGIPQMLSFYRKPMGQHHGEHMERARGPLLQPERSRAKVSLSEGERRDVEWICRREIAEYGYQHTTHDEPSAARKLQLSALCAGYSTAWALLRASRRVRGKI